MKKAILLILFSTIFSLSYCQDNFIWDKIDSIPKTKDQLYSDSKMFIAEVWKSAQAVIQNDDKENGVILIKGSTKFNYPMFMRSIDLYFNYKIIFMMKNNKIRVILNDVYCNSVYCSTFEWPKMPVADEYPKTKGLISTGVSKNNYLEIMKILKNELQTIVDSYLVYMKKTSVTQSNW